ncbi:putative phage abortive infection protein [Phnomibacter sp. MR]|uniref:putative phage abortive infection protein n=1 Tax=Phnomibacter sp. MR TaxID=3042318 RepID=UPI003A80447A
MTPKISGTIEEEIQTALDSNEARTKKFETQISELESKIKTYLNWAWGFVIGGFAIVVLGLFLYLCRNSSNYNLNLLGDFYGGAVASVWSLAGLFFIYVAFLGQKQQILNQQMEIMYSQLELKYTRLELKGQKEEMITQNKTLKQQRFETSFFQLLNNHSTIVKSMIIRHENNRDSVEADGVDCFRIFYSRLSDSIRTRGTGIVVQRLNNLEVVDLNDTLIGYNMFFEKNQNFLGHYFRNLYQIVKFIKNSEIEDKALYIGLIRAQLSSYELALLFYNCLSDYGQVKFYPLIEEFSLLKNLNHGLIFNSEHIDKYSSIN